MVKYAITHRPGDTLPFWRDCYRLNQPFITIEDKLKYALVSWDCISLSSQSQHSLSLNRVGIATKLRELYRDYSRDPLGSQPVDIFVGYIRTTKERAHELAGKVYDALTTRDRADRIERPFPLGVRNAW